jgi:hypothetical protein
LEARFVLNLSGSTKSLLQAAPACFIILAEVTITYNPRQVHGLEIRPEGDGYIVYQPKQDRAHFLNPTAVLVLELCNGMNSTDEIVNLVKQAYDLPDPPAEGVHQAVTQFMSEGLLRKMPANPFAGITPLIISYCRDLTLFTQFVESFRPLRAALGNPLVVVDISLVSKLTLPYIKLLDALEPSLVAIHPAQPSLNLFDSVQDGCHFALVTALEEHKEARAFLYLEDDIVFSSRFLDRLAQVDLDNEMGFLTLYLHNNGYPSGPLNPHDFWGAQCLLIPRSTAELLVREREQMDAEFPPSRGGCDIRWGHYLTSRGYPLYATERSYAQHLGIVSRLHGNPPHVSNCFVP